MIFDQLIHRVIIQENTVSRTKGVKKTDSWATYDTVYMSKRALSAREQSVAGRREMFATHEFGMRFRDNLGASNTEMLPKYRLSYNSKTVDVKSVRAKDDPVTMVLILAEEKV